ncbi:MAG TPA: pilus assembly protein [Methylococcaceae bacterium]|nr:pilus assembly protein [Methylococcaceae bacterium]
MKIKSRYQQQGAETLEFALIAIFYFTLLFGVFEFSRALYTWNVLTEATRRGAKMVSK